MRHHGRFSNVDHWLALASGVYRPFVQRMQTSETARSLVDVLLGWLTLTLLLNLLGF